MKNGKPQCKDIPTQHILQFLYDRKKKGSGWAFMFPIEISGEASIFNVMPVGTDYNLALAKMRNMIYKGLIDGCACGCRGDFEIKERGTLRLYELNYSHALIEAGFREITQYT